METAQLSLLANVVLGAQCCLAAYLDFRYRKLPNLLCMSVFGSGILAGTVIHDLSWVGWSLAHCILALVVGVALFAAAIIGGGDAKFYAAVASWLPIQDGFSMLGAVAASGLLLALVWIPLRTRIAASASDPDTAKEFRKVPYGVAISAGGLIAFVSISVQGA